MLWQTDVKINFFHNFVRDGTDLWCTFAPQNKKHKIMEQFINMVCEMAPYLLLGFLLAGLMHAFIPSRFYRRFFSANRFQSVVNAALFGYNSPAHLSAQFKQITGMSPKTFREQKQHHRIALSEI